MTDEERAEALSLAIRITEGEIHPPGNERMMLAKALVEAQRDIADQNASFELRHAADMRAIKRWREEKPGRELTLPDHADLCVWLLKRMDKIAELNKETDALVSVVEERVGSLARAVVNILRAQGIPDGLIKSTMVKNGATAELIDVVFGQQS